MRIFRNSFTVVALVLSLIFLFQTDTMATETRVGSMGGVGFYMRDNSNIFVFPGTFYSYGDQVIGEMRVKGNHSLYTIGAHLPVSNTAQFGIYLNNPITFDIPSYSEFLPPGLEFIEEVELNHTTDLFYGTELDNFDLGIALRFAMDSYEEDNFSGLPENDHTQSATYFELGAGISNESMDLGLIFALPSASRDQGTVDGTDKYSWGGFGVGFSGRFWLKQKDLIFQFVPLIVANYASLSGELDPAGDDQGGEISHSYLNLAGGLGLNYQINEDNLIVVGLEAIGYSSESYSTKSGDQDGPEGSTTTMILPGIYMGVESQISSWLFGRLGAAQTYTKTTEKEKLDPDADETESVSFEKEFKMTFGIGIMLGSFLLDARINDNLLFEGPNFISGTTQDLAYMLSITYNFGKEEKKGEAK